MELPLVAHFEQEKNEFSNSGLAISLGARDLRVFRTDLFQQKICFSKKNLSNKIYNIS
jgi:hypothetical protein